MTEQEELVSVSTIEKIKELFITKAEEPAVTEETVESPAEDKVSALFEKLDFIIEQNKQIIEGLKTEEVVDEEEEIEKAEEDEKDSEETAEEKDKKEEEEAEEEIEKSEEETTEESAEEEKEKEEEKEDDDAHIEKRATAMVENQSTERTSDFYLKTGRDAFGRKIKR